MNQKISNTAYKRINASYIPFEPIQNLAKKRPNTTKLDLQKMYEESLELTAHYKHLVHQNQQLKEEYQRVESIKLNRQNLISTVEKIVEQKSKELNGKQSNNFSWLVFKLNNKIYELKAKIESKEKAITQLTLSRENQAIRQKQTEIQCLNQIVQFSKSQGLYTTPFQEKEGSEVSIIKEIVWMEQEVKEKETEIIQAQRTYQQEQKQVRKLMQELAQKKAELKSIKEMQVQYNKAQQIYKEEKRKKQQRIAGNKTYLEQLQMQKTDQLKKLENLKIRFAAMEHEENTEIENLKQQLQKLKKEFNQKIKTKQQIVIKFSQDKAPVRSKRQVKRVTYDQVKIIGSNLNYTLALKGISHTDLGRFFNVQTTDQISIRQVYQKLKKYPFQLEKDDEALLIARYAVEDSGDGYFLQDMDTTQSISIVKSILGKLIGEVKIYEKDRAEQLRQLIGPLLFKFGCLVQQTVDLKEGNIRDSSPTKKQLISKQKLVDALQNTLSSLQNQNFLHEQIDFTIFYIFSFSKHLNQLEINRLFTMKDNPIIWPQRQ